MVADETGSEVLDGSTGREHELHVGLLHHDIARTMYNSIVHRHLVAVVVGKSAVAGILLVGPCHVPADLGVGSVLLHIANEVVEVAVGESILHTGILTHLLQGDIVPVLILQGTLDALVAGHFLLGLPVHLVLIVLTVATEILLGVVGMLPEAATTPIEVCNDDVLITGCLGNVVDPLLGIL